MASTLKVGAAFAAVLLCACSPQGMRPQHMAARPPSACTDTGALMAANSHVISEHLYAQASQNAEHAARTALSCGDRWRAANALIVAAELAHQHGDYTRARTLVHEGFGLMRTLRPAQKTVSSALLAQQIHSAKRDMNGQWTYW